MEQSLYDAIGGSDAVREVAEAWHRRVVADDVTGHAFRHGVRSDHTERLAAYLGEAIGGPPCYSREFGSQSSLAALHGGNGEHHEMDDRAIACFAGALIDVGLAADDPRHHSFLAYFTWMTRDTMNAYPDSADDVPAHLAIPHWSFDNFSGEHSPH